MKSLVIHASLSLAVLAACGDGRPGTSDGRHDIERDRRAPLSVVFPGVDWATATPGSQGVDAAKLKAAVDYLDGKLTTVGGAKTLIVIRNGYLIWQGPDTRTAYTLQSATKSFTSTALGLLIEDGKASLGTLARDHDSRLNAKYGGVTLRHFATMTSGYDGNRTAGAGYDCDPSGRCDNWDMGTPLDPVFSPGSKFRYWDEAMTEFGYVLTRIAGGAADAIPALLRSRIADRIGMTAWSWETRATALGDYPAWCGGLRASSRDLARFGHLFLNRGSWAGRQLVSASWVDQATSVQVPPSTPDDLTVERSDGAGHYGFNWWVNGADSKGERTFPGAPAGTYCANGYNVNRLFVIPEWNMVVARTGKQQLDGSGVHFSAFLEMLSRALSGS